MQTFDTYGLNSSLEPVGEEFEGVKYYIADEVDYAMSRDHDDIAATGNHTDFLRDQLDKRQETIEELFQILRYWKERCKELQLP